MIEHGKRNPVARAARTAAALGVLVLLVVGLVRYGPALAGRAGALLPGFPFSSRAAAAPAPANGFFPVEPGWAACGLNRGMTQWEAFQTLRALGHPRRVNAAGAGTWAFGDRAETYRTGGFLVAVSFEAREFDSQTTEPLPQARRGLPFVEAIQCLRPSRLGALTTGMSLTEAVAELGKPPEIFYWESDEPKGGDRPEEMVLAYKQEGLGVIVEVATDRVVGFIVLGKGQ